MSGAEIKLAVAGGLALFAWLFGKKDPGRRTTEIVIDANVNSPTFGHQLDPETGAVLDPDDGPPAPSRMDQLIEESNRAIADFDRAHPEEITP